MANYLFVCAGITHGEKIRKWICAADGADADLIQNSHGQCTAFYLARRGKLDVTRDGGVFKGYAIDHDRHQIMFSGGAASPNVHWPLPGCYIRLQQDRDDLIVGNDFFAQLPMLYFVEDGVVAVSDSVFMLTELRRCLGLPNHVHEDAALSRAWIHGLASQPLGTQTLIDGIHFCTPGAKIRVGLAGSDPTMHIEKVLAREYFSTHISDYKDTILQSAQRAAAIIAAFSQIENANMVLSLSGGIDSRVCLAIMLAHGIKNNFYFKTNQSSKEDYVVAEALAERFDFQFKDAPRRTAEKKEAIPDWLLSCAGIYDPLTSGGASADSRQFRITGVGAEACKGYFRWRPLSRITPAAVGHVSAIRPSINRYKAEVKRCRGGLKAILPDCPQTLVGLSRLLRNKSWTPPKVSADISEAAYREGAQGLHSVGIAAEDPWASEWHYLCFMNAIHAGRHTMASLLAVSPLLQPELVGLSRSSLNTYPEPIDGSPSIMTDLLIALSPELALMPFDEKKKNMSADYVDERSKFLGLAVSGQPYSIVGDPAAVHSGPPEMFLKIMDNHGYKGNFNADNIRELALQGYRCIPQSLKPAYALHKYIVEHELPSHPSPSSWHHKAAGKLMAFLLAKE